MKEVKVKTSSEYSVLIGNGIMENTSVLCEDVFDGKKIAVITDDTVNGLYFDRLGIKNAYKFVFPTVKHRKI